MLLVMLFERGYKNFVFVEIGISSQVIVAFGDRGLVSFIFCEDI